MENNGEAGKLLLNLMKDVEGQRRRNQAAGLGVTGALLGLELVSAVGSADGDGEGIATGTGGKVNHLFRTGVVGFLGGNLVFHTGQDAQFGLYGDIVLVSIVHHLLGEGDVFLVREGGGVNHHGAETHVNAALAQLEAVAVVQVEHNLGMLPAQLFGIFHSTLCHIAQEGLVGVVTGTLGNLENHRALGLGAGLDNGLKLLHVVEIESGDGVTAGNGLLEHLTGVHKTQFFVRNHSVLSKLINCFSIYKGKHFCTIKKQSADGSKKII